MTVTPAPPAALDGTLMGIADDSDPVSQDLQTSDHVARDMRARAAEASNLMKALAHEGRMMILCHLASGEKTVSQLEQLLDQRQAAVSQQLARLRSEGLVRSRRDGKARLYSVADPRAAEVVALMYRLFCAN
ncbi:ArsR/SmtB family transcription factor [Paracoccus sp. R86501]|uniref:ArsR/SmtB family transcription factor n=1 Tax=Paracoccus sp. R86501 TaxID=3101711 RepID=UPI00367144ED